MHPSRRTTSRGLGDTTARARARKIAAFSLPELMVTVAIVGILAAVAIPSYAEYMRGARRSDATVSLIDLAARMERRYTRTGSYAGATIAAGGDTDVLDSADTPGGFYRLSVVESGTTATAFTLKATRDPAAAQAGDDECGDFTLTDLELRGITGSGSVAQCW